MTETQFRDTQQTRDELREILSHPTFREALTIIITKRRILERQFEIINLDKDALQSLRLFNQRIGMEGLILDLHELTTLPPATQNDPASTYGQEEAYRQLQNLQDANTQ